MLKVFKSRLQCHFPKVRLETNISPFICGTSFLDIELSGTTSLLSHMLHSMQDSEKQSCFNLKNDVSFDL